MKLYMVCYNRDNNVEKVVKLTKSLHNAQVAMIGEIRKCAGDDAAKKLLCDIGDGELDEDFTLNINTELNLQLTDYEVEDPVPVSQANKAKIAGDIVGDMDQDTLINYALDRMIEYFNSLGDDQFKQEWENHYAERYPNT